MTRFESKMEHPENFTSRTMGALNKIAEEHWKRQMQQEQKEEELVSSLYACATVHTGSEFPYYPEIPSSPGPPVFFLMQR